MRPIKMDTFEGFTNDSQKSSSNKQLIQIYFNNENVHRDYIVLNLMRIFSFLWDTYDISKTSENVKAIFPIYDINSVII